MEKKLPIPVVVAVVIRRNPNGGLPQVMTHIRNASYPGYDTFYNGTWEAVGERMEEEESILTAVVRGCQEELGSPDLLPRVLGDLGKDITTGKKDHVFSFRPYIFLQQRWGPQPWLGPGFVVVVPDDFEAKAADGETSGHRWWNPAELLAEIERNPGGFMGFHLPLIEKACRDILVGEITI